MVVRFEAMLSEDYDRPAIDSTLKQLCSEKVEPIGRHGKVKTGEDGRNLFAFVGEAAKL